MKRWIGFALALPLITIVAACTTNATNVPPVVTFSPTPAVLELAVGTVNFDGLASGVNVFETFRGPTGFTAVPINTATVTGPLGFAGPAGSADPGAGSTSVTMGAALNSFTEGANGGIHTDSADGTGIGPPSSSQPAPNPFPLQPQFLDAVSGASTTFGGAYRREYGDPPAYPAQSPGGPLGFPEGFYLVALANSPTLPPTGSYTLTVNYTQNGVAAMQSANATLTTNVLLPILAPPSYVSDGAAGGGTVHVTNPGGGVSEILVNVTDVTSGALATVLVTGGGPQTAPIPDGTFTLGDSLRLHAFGFDYSDFELGPPTNTSQSPTLPSQADVTVSSRVTSSQ